MTVCEHWLSETKFKFFGVLRVPKLHLGSEAVQWTAKYQVRAPGDLLTCAKISTHGSFRFSPPSEKRPPRLGSGGTELRMMLTYSEHKTSQFGD